MDEKAEDTGNQPGISYRCRLLRTLPRESDGERKPQPADAELERILLESDPYLAALMKGDKP